MKQFLLLLSLLFLPAHHVQASYTPADLLVAVNAARSAACVPTAPVTTSTENCRGLSPLKLDPKLQVAAAAFALHLAEKDWCHTEHWNPQEGHAGYIQALQSTGYKYKRVGQNLACDFPDASSTVNAWMKSPTHRHELLGADFTDTGIAIATSPRGVTYIVQYFSRPLDQTPIRSRVK